MSKPLRVVIAEDAAVLRDGLVQLLSDRGFEIVAAVADADALRHAVSAAAEPPDVAVVDIRMPPTHTDEGLRAAIDLRRDPVRGGAARQPLRRGRLPAQGPGGARE